MKRPSLFSVILGFLLLTLTAAQETSPSPTSEPTPDQTQQPTSTPSGASPSDDAPSTGTQTSTRPTSTSLSDSDLGPPDVHLKVPELSVGRIELDVDNLRADINLGATVANLVTLNAGISVGVEKVNVTIAEVDAELELVIRLGQLADIVNRTLHSLDLNPLLINLIDGVGDIAEGVIGAVDGLLGSIVSGDSTVNFLIDNLGNIVQEVVGTTGELVHSIVGNYEKNMTFTGQQELLDNGLVQKIYEYEPLGALVRIIFNSVGQIVQATALKSGDGEGEGGEGGEGEASSTSASAAPTATGSG